MSNGEIAYQAFCRYNGSVPNWANLDRADQMQWEFIANELLKQRGEKCPRCPIKTYL